MLLQGLSSYTSYSCRLKASILSESRIHIVRRAMFNFAFSITPQNIWFAVRYYIHTDVPFFSCGCCCCLNTDVQNPSQEQYKKRSQYLYLGNKPTGCPTYATVIFLLWPFSLISSWTYSSRGAPFQITHLRTTGVLISCHFTQID